MNTRRQAVANVDPDPQLSSTQPRHKARRPIMITPLAATMISIWFIVAVMAAVWITMIVVQAEHPKFHCQGNVGVYESRDGSSVVPQAYDPNCVDPKLYNGG